MHTVGAATGLARYHMARQDDVDATSVTLAPALEQGAGPSISAALTLKTLQHTSNVIQTGQKL